jgi:hypothetical protein
MCQSERVICAAIKCGYEVYCGYRHNDIYSQFSFIYPDGEEGFITTNGGRFVTRKEAWYIAHYADQIINHEVGSVGYLCSDSIY